MPEPALPRNHEKPKKTEPAGFFKKIGRLLFEFFRLGVSDGNLNKMKSTSPIEAYLVSMDS